MAEIDDLDAQLLAQMREDFLIESQDILDRLSTLLVQLEQSGDPDLLRAIFRDVHTLKGTAGFVGLAAIQSLAHKLEDVFGALQDGQLSLTPELVDTAFAGVTLLATMREDVMQGGEGEANIAPLVARLEATLQGPGFEPDGVPVDASTGIGKASAERPDQAAGEQDEAFAPTVPPTDRAAVDATLIPAPAPSAASAPPAPASPMLRVPVETLDAMIELVGELITARNALVTIAEQSRDEPLMNSAAAIGRLTRELQATVTSVRLLPVGRLFSRFTGVVRNMAREYGKRVRLEIEGGDTPLDRTISEQMYDPLIHLLRNAVDHGLESPEERRQVGKPEEGTIRLSAERRGDDVVLRIADDGRGIDTTMVRRVAVERGLYSAAEAAALSEEQAVNLIFASGFSTATTVTDLSGRGVGMDVVVQNVRRLRGNVSVETRAGQETAFLIHLPLTLAILQVQLVHVGGHVYALPLHIVRETLYIAPDAVQTMQQGEVIFIRGTALPVRRLCNWLPADSQPPVADREADAQDGAKPAIVVHVTGRDEVVVVDELVGKQQVVIKPLNPYLGAVHGVEGTAILPDGSVTLILDVEGLIDRSR